MIMMWWYGFVKREWGCLINVFFDLMGKLLRDMNRYKIMRVFGENMSCGFLRKFRNGD